MRRFSAFGALAFALSILVSAGAAGLETDVYLVRFVGAGGDERFRYQDLPAAVRYLSPVDFSIRSGNIELRAETSSGVLERGRVLLALRPAGSLERVSVLASAPSGKEPRSAKTVTVSFSLDELLARGGVWSAVPAAWACYTAARRVGWVAGKVWARSVAYDDRTGIFTIKVGLSR